MTVELAISSVIAERGEFRAEAPAMSSRPTGALSRILLGDLVRERHTIFRVSYLMRTARLDARCLRAYRPDTVLKHARNRK
jgi:hypothetical protein